MDLSSLTPRQLDTSWVLTMDDGGDITNTNEDYTIDEEGFQIQQTNTYDPKRAYVIRQEGDDIGRLYGGLIGGVILEADGTFLKIVSTSVIQLESPVRVNIGNDSPLNLPKMSETERDALSAQEGDAIWNTTADRPEMYDGSSWKYITLNS
ncbi:hypothetical protein ACG2F4_07200 [Halalkalibaculum sp. DA3122]|uniref:hypothetical protein n=1 Tax=Halalkalibaculum sp. DA3122 TaxID=3373607 RepID=UPI003753E909